VTVLHHAANLGKGQRFLSQNSTGIVTADADGEYSSEEIFRILRILEENPETLYLGSRKLVDHPPFGFVLSRKILSFIPIVI
jgi:hypothetical protein